MRRWPQAALIGAVRAYRFFLSPVLGNACRFEPTCSAYALESLRRHGALTGSALTVGRIARCHPWCAGGFDPAPTERPSFFTALLGRASADATGPRRPFEPTP